jgi:hypothetical protein
MLSCQDSGATRMTVTLAGGPASRFIWPSSSLAQALSSNNKAIDVKRMGNP